MNPPFIAVPPGSAAHATRAERRRLNRSERQPLIGGSGTDQEARGIAARRWGLLGVCPAMGQVDKSVSRQIASQDSLGQ